VTIWEYSRGTAGVGDPALRVGRVRAAVVLDAVDLDDDTGAVRGQEQEVHPLPVQSP
jgi:hypothetical protein